MPFSHLTPCTLSPEPSLALVARPPHIGTGVVGFPVGHAAMRADDFLTSTTTTTTTKPTWRPRGPRTTSPRTTIPPHLIPIGPDGEPLLSPDGQYLGGERGDELGPIIPELTTERPSNSSGFFSSLFGANDDDGGQDNDDDPGAIP